MRHQIRSLEKPRKAICRLKSVEKVNGTDGRARVCPEHKRQEIRAIVKGKLSSMREVEQEAISVVKARKPQSIV